MKYNFDEIIDRSGTHAAKTDILPVKAQEGSLSLWVADMDFPCAQPIIDALHKRIDHKIFGYTNYHNDELKEAVQSWYQQRHGWQIAKDTLFFSPGIVPAIAFIINAFSEEGDGIVVQKPVYYPFMAKTEGNNRVVVNNALIRQGDTYVMDYEDLDKKLADPQNKIFILCNPHNPVGRVWREEELRKVVDIAKKYNKLIISDEIHGDLTRIGVDYNALLKVAPDYQDNIIACTAPSKTFNLAGGQFSNVVIPNKVNQEKWLKIADIKYSLSLCSPFGLTATLAAYRDGAEWLDQVREYIDGNLQYVAEFVATNLPKAQMIKCEGTYLAWIDVSGYCTDKDKLEDAMLQVAKVVLDEGYIFGDEGIGFERINIASPRSIIVDCMERMKKGLESL